MLFLLNKNQLNSVHIYTVRGRNNSRNVARRCSMVCFEPADMWTSLRKLWLGVMEDRRDGSSLVLPGFVISLSELMVSKVWVLFSKAFRVGTSFLGPVRRSAEDDRRRDGRDDQEEPEEEPVADEGHLLPFDFRHFPFLLLLLAGFVLLDRRVHPVEYPKQVALEALRHYVLH